MIQFDTRSDCEYEEANDLPGQFQCTDCFVAADPETRLLMSTFPPWRFYEYNTTDDTKRRNTPVRVLVCSENNKLICVAIRDGVLDFQTGIDPVDVCHVPLWTEDHLQQIALLDWHQQTIFLAREGFTLGSEILCALYENDD